MRPVQRRDPDPMPSRRRALLIGLAAALSLTGPALAEGDPPGPHGMEGLPARDENYSGHDHGDHARDLGPAGATYDLRVIDWSFLEQAWMAPFPRWRDAIAGAGSRRQRSLAAGTDGFSQVHR